MRQKEDLDESKKLDDEDERDKDVEDFERVQMGLQVHKKRKAGGLGHSDSQKKSKQKLEHNLDDLVCFPFSSLRHADAYSPKFRRSRQHSGFHHRHQTLNQKHSRTNHPSYKVYVHRLPKRLRITIL